VRYEGQKDQLNVYQRQNSVAKEDFYHDFYPRRPLPNDERMVRQRFDFRDYPRGSPYRYPDRRTMDARRDFEKLGKPAEAKKDVKIVEKVDAKKDSKIAEKLGKPVEAKKDENQ